MNSQPLNNHSSQSSKKDNNNNNNDFITRSKPPAGSAWSLSLRSDYHKAQDSQTILPISNDGSGRGHEQPPVDHNKVYKQADAVCMMKQKSSTSRTKTPANDNRENNIKSSSNSPPQKKRISSSSWFVSKEHTTTSQQTQIFKDENRKNSNNNSNPSKKGELGTATPSFAKMISLARKEIPIILGMSFLMTLNESAKLLDPIIVGKAYDVLVRSDFNDQQKMQEISKYMLFAILLRGITTVIGCFRGVVLGVAAEGVVARIRNDLYACLLKQDIAFFDTHPVGDLISRLGSDTTLLQTTISKNLSALILSFIRVFACLGLMFWISTKLAVSCILIAIIAVIVVLPSSGKVKNISAKYQACLGEAQTCSAETLSAIRTVQAFGAEDREKERYAKHIGNPDVHTYPWWSCWSGAAETTSNTYLHGCSLSAVISVAEATMVGIMFLSTFGLLWYGFTLVVKNEMTLGSLTAFQAYMIQVGLGVGNSHAQIAQIATAWGATGRIFYLLEREPSIGKNNNTSDKGTIDTYDTNSDVESYQVDEIVDDMERGGGVCTRTLCKTPPNNNVGASSNNQIILNQKQQDTGTMLESLQGNIQFKDVSFAYPSRPDNSILDNFDLTVQANSTTALVGRSGAGKSTVVSLLQRFYDIDKGKISIDGHDIQSFDLAWLRRQIGYVQQEPQLLGLTIKENLLYGVENVENVTQEQLDDVCKQANAYDFIHEFPDGYDTLVGERGVQLSGGQKQRLAIGRALLTNCRILLMDEATSALDAESEYLVQEAIDNAVQGRTVIIIAHRLSTVQNADQIVVMKDHRMASIGTHNELMRKCSIYEELIRRQSVIISNDEQVDCVSL